MEFFLFVLPNWKHSFRGIMENCIGSNGKSITPNDWKTFQWKKRTLFHIVLVERRLTSVDFCFFAESFFYLPPLETLSRIFVENCIAFSAFPCGEVVVCSLYQKMEKVFCRKMSCVSLLFLQEMGFINMSSVLPDAIGERKKMVDWNLWDLVRHNKRLIIGCFCVEREMFVSYYVTAEMLKNIVNMHFE